MKIESYFNCSSLLRREAGREGVQRAGEGFTLAEVLIALTVIGVISAITVPVLMQNAQKQEYVTALKKAYSTLSQVTNQIIAEEGSPKGSDGGWASSSENIYKIYKKYLIQAKDCNMQKGCFSQGTVKLLNGNNNAVWDKYSRRLALNDGTHLLFEIKGSQPECTGSEHGSNSVCARIWVDINGAKLPNQWGRDVFFLVLKENGLYPQGCDAADVDKECGKSAQGWGCACKVLREGAMNY